VFAFGMVVIEVFTGRPPFSEFTALVIPSLIMDGKCPVRPQEGQELGLTDSIWDMTNRCWHKDPARRPAMMEVVGLLRELFISPLSIEADIETDLSDFLQEYRTWDKDDQREMAQELADRLDEDLDSVDLHEEKRKQYLRHMRRLCGIFGVLPSSFVLQPAFIEREVEPFTFGGYSKVYRATFHGRPIVMKVLDIAHQADREKLHGLLAREVVGWKWLQHENILPFLGVMFAPSISIVSPRMENGNIMDFIKVHPSYNRLDLLVGAVTGLEYLHQHDIVHGNLKGVNILIDSEHRARLADFGLAVIIDETTSRTTATGSELKGTTRRMAPELLLPEEFGYNGRLMKQLPSKDTDIYAIGMTILEVLTGCAPFAGVTRDETVILKVIQGDRPERPASGLSDMLWELLVATWVVQHALEPPRRPSARTVLERLKECVDHWGESTVPL